MTTIVELHIGAGANIRYLGVQGLSEKSWVFGTQQAEIQRDANLDWVALGFGAAKGRVRMASRLAGPGATGKVTGAYASRGSQHLDFDTFQEHAAENCVSDLAFRGVLNDHATSVWSGMIRVDVGAQKTDAFQESRNLLLSRKAHADAIPGLEIEADDVRCTHAAAIAQLDDEQIFYLRARGLPENQARRLVIEGFLAELVERFDEGRSRDALAAALDERLNLVLSV
jgi:Fe-S cluster assembly protein SufD